MTRREDVLRRDTSSLPHHPAVGEEAGDAGIVLGAGKVHDNGSLCFPLRRIFVCCAHEAVAVTVTW